MTIFSGHDFRQDYEQKKHDFTQFFISVTEGKEVAARMPAVAGTQFFHQTQEFKATVGDLRKEAARHLKQEKVLGHAKNFKGKRFVKGDGRQRHS